MPRLSVALLLFVLLTLVGGPRSVAPDAPSERRQTAALDVAPAAVAAVTDQRDPSTPLPIGVAVAPAFAPPDARLESELSFAEVGAPPRSSIPIVRRARAPPAA